MIIIGAKGHAKEIYDILNIENYPSIFFFDDVTNDIFVGAKAELEKNIWMVAAELGQEPGL